MEYSIRTSSILKTTVWKFLFCFGEHISNLWYGLTSLCYYLSFLAAASTCQIQEAAVGLHAMSVSNTVFKKEKEKKNISTAQKKGLKNYLNPGGPQRLCCLYTQSYDVLQKGDLRGTVELEPRNLTEVELGWKLLLAAFHSHVRRTVDMSKDTLFFFRFFFGDAFEQIQTQMQMQTI